MSIGSGLRGMGIRDKPQDRQLVAQFRGSFRPFSERRGRARKPATGWLCCEAAARVLSGAICTRCRRIFGRTLASAPPCNLSPLFCGQSRMCARSRSNGRRTLGRVLMWLRTDSVVPGRAIVERMPYHCVERIRAQRKRFHWIPVVVIASLILAAPFAWSFR